MSRPLYTGLLLELTLYLALGAICFLVLFALWHAVKEKKEWKRANNRYLFPLPRKKNKS